MDKAYFGKYVHLFLEKKMCILQLEAGSKIVGKKYEGANKYHRTRLILFGVHFLCEFYCKLIILRDTSLVFMITILHKRNNKT